MTTEVSGVTDEGDYSNKLSLYQMLNKDIRKQSLVADPNLINAWINSKTSSTSLMRGQGQAFVDAALESKLDIVYLVSHAAWETGWGNPVNSEGSPSIVKKKANWFGIAAYDSNPSESAKTFSNLSRGIIEGAQWIANNYISKGQETLYKMRFYSPNPAHQYATDSGWANGIANTMLSSPFQVQLAKANGGANATNASGVPIDPTTYQATNQDFAKLAMGDHSHDPITMGMKPTGRAPDYYNDDFSQMPHRRVHADYFFRIGDTRFVIPPTQIRVSETSGIDIHKTLRQKQSLKTMSGNKVKYIDLTLMLTDLNQINGFEMSGPNADVYFMDGLRALLAQMKSMPFLPIENDYLNDIHSIFAVAILACTVETVPGFPKVLQVNLSLVEYDTLTFLNKPSWSYDDHFMWPLFRWHYQRKLNGRAVKSSDNLRFYGDNASLNFWFLNEEALQSNEDKIIKRNEAAFKNNERELTWLDFKGTDNDTSTIDSKLFDKWDAPDELIIVSMQASTGNTLTPLTTSIGGKPTYQYFGAQDTRINVIFQTTSPLAVKALSALKDRMDRYAREYRDRFVSSMLRVDNDFVNMLGVSSVMIESLTVNTVPNQPGMFFIAMSLISYDQTQYKDQTLNFLTGAGDNTSKGNAGNYLQGVARDVFQNFVIEAVAADVSLNAMELYPDLDLPTYEEANAIIPLINSWRKARDLFELPVTALEIPFGAKFVDPDFYFTYPSLEDFSADYQEMAKQSGDDTDWKGFFGTKLAAELEGYDPNVLDMYKGMNLQDDDAVIKGFRADYGYVLNKDKYASRFLVKAWETRGDTATWETNNVPVIGGGSISVGYYGRQRPAAQETKFYGEEEYFYRMMHDMIIFDRRGTMLRAFPTFVFLIIDEGQQINVRKFWDNYYAYHSIVDISVHMDRRNPIHTAYIKLSNVYGSLNQTSQFDSPPLETPGLWDVVWSSMFHKMRERELEERLKVYESAQLMAGARIHLRMGYGSTASMLPAVFNGIISEIDTNDVVTLVAQSFGHELTKLIGARTDETTSWFHESAEPNGIFRYYMTARRSTFNFAMRGEGSPASYQSNYGIDHFGFMTFKDDANAFSTFFEYINIFSNESSTPSAEDYDIMKNIYLTSGRSHGGRAPGTAQVQDEVIADTKPILITKYKDMTVSLIDKMQGSPGVSSEFTTDAKTGKRYNWTVATQAIDDQTHKLDKTDTTAPVVDVTDLRSLENAIKRYKFTDADKKTYVNDSIFSYFATGFRTEGLYNKQDATNTSWSTDLDKNKKIIANKFDNFSGTGAEKTTILDTLYAMAAEWVAVSTKVVDVKVAEDKESGDEKNIRIRLDDKSPWDVFRTLEHVYPEYIVYPHIHNFGYTLFYGKPWWDVQCQYILPPNTANDPEYGKKISDYRELTKPFGQFHIYTGQEDIIGNNIKVVGSNLTTTVIPIYHEGSGDTQISPVWADYNILGSFQKTTIVDTGLADYWFKTLGIKQAMNLFGSNNKYQNYSMRFAQRAVAESFKDMYQGELIIIGDPSVKPYDTFFMDDNYSKMNGTADVGVVIHNMSVDTGFTTSIKPDLCVAEDPKPEVSDKTFDDPNSDKASVKAANLAKMTLKGTAYAYMGLRVYRAAKHMAQVKTWSGAYKFLARNGKWSAITKRVKTTLTAIRGVKRIRSEVKVGGAILKSIRIGWTAFFRATSLTEAASGVGIPGALVTVGLWLAGEAVFAAIDRLFSVKYKNVIKIFPLYYKGIPYVAGINGHKDLIPGWEDNGSGRAMQTGSFTPGGTNQNDQSGQSNYAYNEDIGEKTGLGINMTLDDWANSISSQQKFYWPVAAKSSLRADMTKRISSGFHTTSRPDHNGIDIVPDVDQNRNIFSWTDGTVIYAGPASGFGNAIVLHHTPAPEGNRMYLSQHLYTVYGHMKAEDVLVKQGDTVLAGQKIALMGSEGESSGIHLHFEIIAPKKSSSNSWLPTEFPTKVNSKPGLQWSDVGHLFNGKSDDIDVDSVWSFIRNPILATPINPVITLDALMKYHPDSTIISSMGKDYVGTKTNLYGGIR
jgi:beta-N-acetylglucosaminidase/murein DD-endopeptidase MepM/ murein hydrolase activator NlpD